MTNLRSRLTVLSINPLRPNNDLSQTSHCNIKGLSASDAEKFINVTGSLEMVLNVSKT